MNSFQNAGSAVRMSHEGASIQLPKVNLVENNDQMRQLVDKWMTEKAELTEIGAFIESIGSVDLKKQYYGVIGLRKLVSLESDPPIQAVLDSGIVPILIQIMQSTTEPHLQLESAWCLANLCSGSSEEASFVVEKGVIPGFIQLLGSPKPDIVEQGMWGLGNIAGDSHVFRDIILGYGAVEAVVRALERNQKRSVVTNGVWVLSNLCSRKPLAQWSLISKAVPSFCNIIKKEDDNQVLMDAVWGLFYASEQTQGAQYLVSLDIIPHLVHFLSSPEIGLVVSSLRILGNIISGPEEQASVVLKEKDFLPELLKLTDHKKSAIRREVFWIISNITAGSNAQMDSIMGNPAYVAKLIKAVKEDEQKVKVEAAFAISNSTIKCTAPQLLRLLQSGVFKCIVELLDSNLDKIILIALKGLFNILQYAENFELNDETQQNRFIGELDKLEGINKLEELQSHANEKIYENTIRILEAFFEGEGEDE